jgi:succinate dehydrogenase / fumarate reductase cytochrome b subunit
VSIVTFYRSTVGKKIIMGVTGLIGIAFVILHMVGNLQAFVGPAKLNAYSAALHGPLNELLWIVRVVLIVAVVLHVLMAYQLTLISRAARPIDYTTRTPQVSTLAARTMKWGGVLILLFIILHLLHFTTETIDPAGWRGMTDAVGHRDIYGDIVASFRIWWVAAFYIVVMMVLGLHLFHGAWSSFRSLGYAKPSQHPLKRRLALIVTLAVWLGFTLVPVGVVVGVLR